MLAVSIVVNVNCKPDEEIKQSLFADDATYFLNNNYDSFHNLIESLTLSGMTSGLKLNKSKCTELRGGKLKQKNGGIRLTNIDAFLNAIKCSWAKRYLDHTNTSKWKLFYQKILNKYGDSLLFECNISNIILHEIANENIFLSDVLSAWSDVTHYLETQTSSKTILWNNKDITSNNKTFFYKDWFERSIKYVNQLYDYRIKDFYSFDDICHIYGIPSNNVLKYYTLIKSIPIHMKSETNTNNTPCSQTQYVENILGRENKTNNIILHTTI
ncbi:hypothetical protein DPMN_140950 [Dreissena polymorpha]|uniref:Reverse transcriptase domain-containing protein n=1 Tax=Dreissena polymorpha TaxID=45954 RepID=A0A9D4G8J5_DREPO|nr:hypothetical protein DPMN_140950 [Dreissena polymorpha]